MFVYCFTTCVGYFLVILDQSRSMVPNLPYIWGLMTLLLIPFSIVSSYSSLRFGGVISVTALFILMISIIFNYFALPIEKTYTGMPKGQNIFAAFPVLSLGYHCHSSSIQIYRKVARRDQYPLIIICSFLVCFVIYNLVASFNLATFGGGVNPDLLLSYDNNDKIMIPARLGIIGCVICPYAVFAIMGREILMTNPKSISRIMFGMGWFFVASFAGLTIPNFGVCLQIMGSMTALLAFFFPGICIIVTYVKSNFYLTIYGVFIAFFGTYLFFYNIILTFYHNYQ